VSPALGTILSLAVVALLLLPPGYGALRLAGSRADGPAGLAAALALGWAIVLPVLLLEVALHGRYLVPALAVVCLAWLRPGRAAAVQARALLPDLALPLALGAMAYAANASDFRIGPGGASVRLGFDVADRVTYSLVADELLRAAPHRLENPLFAPLPMQYSLFPALAGLLLRGYAGADGLAAFLWQLPAIGLVFVGLAVTGLLAEWGASRSTRVVTTLLVALGGDLSFLTVTRDRTGLERSSHFFAFHSFSAEALLYNPWVWGLPLTLAALILAGRWLNGGRAPELALLGLVVGALFQTKVFAFLALVAGSLVAALLLRSRRQAAVAGAALLGGAPWLWLTGLTPGGRGGWPLVADPLRPVRLSMEVNATLRSAASAFGDAGPLTLLLGTLVFLAGGLGVRLFGVPYLLRQARSDASGLHAFVGLTMAIAVCASLALRGHPMAVDGIQFLMLTQYLSWLYAGPALVAWLAQGVWLVAPLIAVALVAPVTSLARKIAPARFTAAGSLDRVRVTLRPDTLAACEWLRARSDPRDRLVLPLAGDPEDVGGMKPLLVAALARRRVVAYGAPLGIPVERVAERREWTRRVYEETDAAVVQDALDRLGAQWIWDDAARPLRATPAGWEPQQAATTIRLLSRGRNGS
jgi:hypothetical protein